MKNVSKSTSLLVKISMLTAIAVMLMYFDFPILPSAIFLKIDLSDVPALVGAFAFGPLVGVVIEALKNVLIIVFKGTQTGFVGEFANFVIGATFVLTAGLIYNIKKSRVTALIALLVATIVMSIVGVLANYFVFMPLYNIPREGAGKYLTATIIPFNLFKGVIISTITLVIYKRIAVILHAEKVDVFTKKQVDL